MKRNRTTHRKIAATVARFNRESTPAKRAFSPDKHFFEKMLADPFTSPRDKAHYARQLAAIDAREAALRAARDAIAKATGQ